MASPSNILLGALSPDACLTVTDLAAATGLERRVIVKTAGMLILRGFAERAEVGCFTLSPEGAAFRAAGGVITSGPKAPLTQTFRRPHKVTLRDRLWAALRIRGKASLPELLERADDGRSIDPATARRYLMALTKIGYLRELRREAGTAPTSNGFKRWALIRDTGPEAPQLRVRTHTLYDPNTGEEFFLADGAS